jgi:hypothetical protein
MAMFESRVNPPPRRDLPQVLLAAVVAVFAVAMIVGGSAKQDAGTEVSPWVWPIAGLLLVAAVTIFEWHLLWRAWHPPLMLDPGALPATFDWDAVGRRMSDYYDTADAATASPDENDSVYLAIEDTVTMEYVDVVRDLLKGYDGEISSYRLDPEVGVDQSGRACFVGSKDIWRLDPAVVLPSPHRRDQLLLVDRIDAEAHLRPDGPWRMSVLHGRVVDPVTGEVAFRRTNHPTAPGISDMFGPRNIIGFVES